MATFSFDELDKYAPKKVTVAITPDLNGYEYTDTNEAQICYDTVTLKSLDVINAFLFLRSIAIQRKREELKQRKKYKAIGKIKSLSTFRGK